MIVGVYYLFERSLDEWEGRVKAGTGRVFGISFNPREIPFDAVILHSLKGSLCMEDRICIHDKEFNDCTHCQVSLSAFLASQ